MVIVFLIVLGLCLGSFVEASVWRLHELDTLKGRKSKAAHDRRAALSIAKGRSMCPQCRHELAAQDLIPLLSWLFLRGKCRYCQKPIDWQDPAVELMLTALFVLSYFYWPYGWNANGMFQFVVWLVLLCGFMALVIYDLRWMLLPNKIVFGLLSIVVVELLVRLLFFHGGWVALLGALWGFLVLGGLFYVLFQLSGGKWIGGGDVKLGFLLGIIVSGPLSSFLLLFIASSSGTVVSIPLILTKKLKRNTRIPFGPFLILAAVIVELFGLSIINWYKRQLLI